MSLTAPDLGQVPLSPVLAATLAHASDAAGQMGFDEVALEHLLAALCDDPDAVAVLDASGIDAARIKGAAVDQLMRAAGRGAPIGGMLSVSADMRRILEASAAAARGGKRREINGAIVLAAIVGDAQTNAAQILQAHGLTFETAIRALQAALRDGSLPNRPTEMPPLAGDVLARARERVQSRSAPTLKQLMADMPRPIPPPPMPGAPAFQSDLPQPAEFPLAGLSDGGALAAAQMAETVVVEVAPAQFALAEPAVSPDEEAVVSGLDAVADVNPATPSETPSADAEPEAAPVHADNPPEVAADPPVAQAAPSIGATPPPAIEPQASEQKSSVSVELSLPPSPFGYPIPPAGPADAPRPALASSSAPMPSPQFAQNPTPVLTGLPPGLATGAAMPAPVPFGDLPLLYERRPPGPHLPPPIPQPRGGPDLGRPAPPFAAPGGPPPGQPHLPHNYAPQPPFGPRGAAPPAWPNQASGQIDPVLAGPSATPVRSERSAPSDGPAIQDDIPASMRAGLSSRVEVRIAKNALKDFTDRSGAPRAHGAAVTHAITVRIRAPEGDFTVESASPETLWIERGFWMTGDDVAVWRFMVTPVTRGWGRLQVLASIRTLSSDGTFVETALPDRIAEVKIRRARGAILGRIAAWSIAAGVGALLALYGARGYEIVLPIVQRYIN